MQRALPLALLALLLAPALTGCLQQPSTPALEVGVPPRNPRDGMEAPARLVGAWTFEPDAGVTAAPVPGARGQGLALGEAPFTAVAPVAEGAAPAGGLALWISPDAADGSVRVARVEAEGCPPVDVHLLPNRTLRVAAEPGCGAGFTLASPAPLPDGWTHVEADWSIGHDARLHVDGVLVAAAPLPGEVPAEPGVAYTITVGGDGAGAVVDEVQLYTGPLEEGLIRSLASLLDEAREEVPTEATAPRALWRLDAVDRAPDGCCYADRLHPDVYAKPVGSPEQVPGVSGEALRFNGRDQWLNTPFSLSDLQGEGALAFWMKPDPSPERPQTLFYAGNACAKLWVMLQQDQRVAYNWTWDCPEHGTRGGDVVWGHLDASSPYGWHHVALTWGERGHEIWVNGDLAGSAGGGAVTVPDGAWRAPAPEAPGTACDTDCTRLRAGVHVWHGNALYPYAGALDEIALYDRQPSPAEIAGLAAREPAEPSASEALLAHYRLDPSDVDPSDPVALREAEGRTHPARHGDGALGKPRFTDGRIGGALAYAGDGSGLGLSFGLGRPGDDGTIALWFLADPAPERGVLIAAGSPCGRIDLSYTTFENARLLANRTSTCDDTIEGTATLADAGFDLGVWNHVAFTWSGDGHALYLNGKLVGSSLEPAATFDPDACCRMYAGKRLSAPDSPYPDWGFTGALDDLRLYGRALTPLEVAALVEEAS